MNFIKIISENFDNSNFKITDLQKDYVIFMIPPHRSALRDREADVFGFINHVKVVEYAIYYNFNGNDYILGIKKDIDVEINDDEEEVLHDKNKYTSIVIQHVFDSMSNGNFICENHENGEKISLTKIQLNDLLNMIRANSQLVLQKSVIDFNTDRVELIHED